MILSIIEAGMFQKNKPQERIMKTLLIVVGLILLLGISAFAIMALKATSGRPKGPTGD
jgi:flagellar basal body-associated protein FliL